MSRLITLHVSYEPHTWRWSAEAYRTVANRRGLRLSIGPFHVALSTATY